MVLFILIPLGRYSVNLHFADWIGNQDPEPLGTQTVNGLQVVQNTQDLLFDVCSFALSSVNLCAMLLRVYACICVLSCTQVRFSDSELTSRFNAFFLSLSLLYNTLRHLCQPPWNNWSPVNHSTGKTQILFYATRKLSRTLGFQKDLEEHLACCRRSF